MGSPIYAQQSECKVKMASISGSYTGDCKKGLAHGKGNARGIDSYEGQFSKDCLKGKGYTGGQMAPGMMESGRME